MRRKLLATITISLCLLLSACGGGSNSKQEAKETKVDIATEQEKESTSEEEFKSKYDTLITGIVLLNTYSDYCGATHSTIWNSVGVDDVAKYISYVREYGKEQSIGDSLIAKAYNVSPFNNSDLNKVKDYVEQYQTALEEIPTLREDLETQYKELNESYGSDYNLSEIKDFYIESDSYAEYAINIDGSYITYTQTLAEYQESLKKLQKSAELAY